MTKTKKEGVSEEKSIKSSIKKNKKIAIGIAVVFLLLLFFSGYRAWLSFYFLTTDDLVLRVEPNDKSLFVHYGELPNVTIKVSIDNSIMCNSMCNYAFTDLSDGAVIDKGIFTSKGIGKKFIKDFTLSAGGAGSGQKIYRFDAQCNNVKTFYCPTNEDKRQRSTFITLNYDISEFEKALKNSLKPKIAGIIDRIKETDSDIQRANNRFFELGFSVNLNQIEDIKEILNNDYDRLVLELENIVMIWSEEDYTLLSQLFNRSYEDRISEIDTGILSINQSINSIIGLHNSFIKGVNGVDNELRSINETIWFLNRADKDLLNRHMKLMNRIAAIKSRIKENSFPDYEFVEEEINGTKSSFLELDKESKEQFREISLKGIYYASIEKEKFCLIKNNCSEKTDFSMEILGSLGINEKIVESTCDSVSLLGKQYEGENNRSEELMKSYNEAEVNDIVNQAEREKTLAAGKNIFDSLKGINASEQFNMSLNFLIDISKTNFTSEFIDYGVFTEKEILSLAKLNLSNGSMEYLNNYCKNKPKIDLLQYYGNETMLGEVNEVYMENFKTRIKMELTENYPVCCIFGECKRCCTSDECNKDVSLYPILFLHGHAMNSDNSPDYSLDAFNKIQAKLQEEGYISAGTITPKSDYTEISRGEWGQLSKPISVKGSYYLVSYYNLGSYTLTTQKSESIETYAIRLKELVDLLKFRTGKDKVIIIAHSMGGLVARSYLQIFGEEDVDKLIMIAVPNKGVSGSVSSYCPILGEKKECNDINEDSIFIKKLNDPNKVPKNAKIFNIFGIGCNIDGKTGDGIVSKENTELEHAENLYINGTCEGISKTLHTQILNIEKYPEVYDIIRSILMY